MAAFGEILSVGRALDHEAAWRDLAVRAEPNPFGEVDFLRPALEHLGGGRVACVWAGPERDALIAIAAILPPPGRLGFTRVWRSEQAALAGWLIDPVVGRAALAGLVVALRLAFPFSAGLIAPRIATDSALARIEQAERTFNPFQRAAIDFRSAEKPNGKRNKEWGRLERRLGERGRVDTRVSGDTEAFERFLSMEAKGWKGKRGTALASEPERASFARETAAGFATRGRLAVFELLVSGAPIAAGVVLKADRRAFFWKIAHDEAFAAFSPGVLLTRALTRTIAESGEIDVIDSCAAPDHPMIDHVWPNRLEFVDLAIPNHGSPLFEPGLLWESLAPRLKEQAKRILLPLLGRKRS